MTSKTCATCKYFDLTQSLPKSVAKIWGACTLATTDNGTAFHPKSLALAVDDEQYGADLLTSPEFGCNQHADFVTEK